MNHATRMPLCVGLVLVALLLAGWSATPPAPTATPPAPSATPTPTESAVTPTPPGKSTVTPVPPGTELDLVIMGDVILFNSAARFAAQIEKDLGAKVIVHDYAEGDHGMTTLLRRVRMDEALRKTIQEADIVFFDIGLKPFDFALATYVSPARADCGGTDSQDCLREAVTQYKAEVDAVFAEIVSLRSPSDALIRTMDIYQYKVKEQKAADAFHAVNSYWREANEHVAQLAAKYQIPMAPVYTAFMGADGIGDPRDLGLVESDGVRPSEKGVDLIVQIFAGLGYEPAPQP